MIKPTSAPIMAANNGTNRQRTIDLRRYSNRRLYDLTQSRYVTLDEVYRLIREGHSVRVTDSKTDEDISAKVLAQVILDRDCHKLRIFPVELFHELIRVNERMVLDFVETYFNRALLAFFESRREFEVYLRNVLGVRVPGSPQQEWADMMRRFSAAWLEANGARSQSEAKETVAADVGDEKKADLSRVVDDLRKEVADLQQQIESLQAVEVSS